MSNPTHMLNFKNNYFEVVDYAGKDKKYNAHRWKCKCACGKIIILRTQVVKSGATKSCGCKRPRFAKGHPYGKRYKPIHGLSKHPLFRVWSHIIDRCYKLLPKHINYRYYRGKGIEMCGEWLHNFKAFYDWAIASGWKKGLTIDRKDSDGNYEPNNCEFVTRSENSRRMVKDNPVHGEFNGNSLFTFEEVERIREKLSAGVKNIILAKEFNVCPTTISAIKREKNWKKR